MGITVVLLLPRGIAAFPEMALAMTVLAVLLIVGSTYLIICGTKRKALAAVGGALAGIVCSGVLAVVVVRLSGLSGMHDEDLGAIMRFTAGRNMDFRELLVIGIMLGTLGVVMDVAIGVASATSELKKASPGLAVKELRKHGMAVGGKVMGSMVMGLALAYMGINVGLFMLPYADTRVGLSEVLGNEWVVAETFRLLVGVTAVVWTVPMTAWLAAAVECGRKVER